MRSVSPGAGPGLRHRTPVVRSLWMPGPNSGRALSDDSASGSAGRPGRHSARAFDLYLRLAAGGAQMRGRVCADRSVLPGGPNRVHRGGFRSLPRCSPRPSSKTAAGEVRCPQLALDTVADRIDWQPTSRVDVVHDKDALAYIIYTSGTTGRPKGVAVTQANICNFISVCTPIYGVTAADRVYQDDHRFRFFDRGNLADLLRLRHADRWTDGSPPARVGLVRLSLRERGDNPLLCADAAGDGRSRRADTAGSAGRRRVLPGRPCQALEPAGAAHAQHLWPNRDDRHGHMG